MDWKEKIIVGMKLIAESCASNDSWAACKYCPFIEICDDLITAHKVRKEDFERVADIFASEITSFENKKK